MDEDILFRDELKTIRDAVALLTAQACPNSPGPPPIMRSS